MGYFFKFVAKIYILHLKILVNLLKKLCTGTAFLSKNVLTLKTVVYKIGIALE